MGRGNNPDKNKHRRKAITNTETLSNQGFVFQLNKNQTIEMY